MIQNCAATKDMFHWLATCDKAGGLILEITTLTDPNIQLLNFFLIINLLSHHPLTVPLRQDLHMNLLEHLGVEGVVKLSHELMFQPNLQKMQLSKISGWARVRTLVLNVPSSCSHLPLGGISRSAVALYTTHSFLTPSSSSPARIASDVFPCARFLSSKRPLVIFITIVLTYPRSKISVWLM